MFFDLLAVAELPELGQSGRARRSRRLMPGPVTALLPNPAHRFPLACRADPSTLGLRVPRRCRGLAACGGRSPVERQPLGRRGRPPARGRAGALARRRRPGDRRRRAPGTPSTVVDLRRYEDEAPGRSCAPARLTRQLGGRVQLIGPSPDPLPQGTSIWSCAGFVTQLPADYFNAPLEEVDPEIAEVLAKELHRQQRTLEMIASENFVPGRCWRRRARVLTNKYAEGYPGRRYYGGCEHVDVVEQLAIDRVKALFGAEHANVQPHSGAQANVAVYLALLQPGRHHPRPGPGPRRPSHPRHAAQLLRQAVQRRRLRRRPRDEPDRHGRGRAARPRAQAEADRRRLVGAIRASSTSPASARSPTRSAPT